MEVNDTLRVYNVGGIWWLAVCWGC